MLERGNDILLKAFSPDNVLNSSSYLDFLYTRNIFSSDEYLRKLELQSIVGISGVRDTPLQPWVVPSAYERLKIIYDVQGDMHADQVPSDVQSWQRALSNELKHWSAGYVWFNGLADFRPLQRSQLSRLCYIHAPLVLISYIQRFHGQEGVKMVNMMEWMRTSFAPNLLNRHIFGNS